MKIEFVSISNIKENTKNPRVIKDNEFDLLVKSIIEFPEMLEIRPIVVNGDYIVLGGNRRLKACKQAGLKKVPIIFASSLTKEQQQRFIIVDNKSSGEWDFEMLRSWDQESLSSWGLDMPLFEEEEIKDISDNIKSEFKIEITCKNEQQQEKLYNKFIADGYNCRLLSL